MIGRTRGNIVQGVDQKSGIPINEMRAKVIFPS